MESSDSQEQDSWGRWTLVVVGTALATGLVALVIVVGLLQTAWGRERASRQLESTVSGEIPGRMEIGSLDRLELFSPFGMVHARVRSLTFLGPDGSEVVHLDAASVDFDPTALFGRTIRFDGAKVEGGTVTVEPGERGVTKLENAFSGPGASSNPRPFAIDFRGMHVREMRLEVSPDPSTEVLLVDIEGFLGIFQARDAKGVTVKFEEMSARLNDLGVLPLSAELREIEGEVLGKREQSIDIDYRADQKIGEFDGNFAFFPKRKKKVRLTFSDRGGGVTLGALAAKFRSELGGTVEVKLK